MKKIMVLGEYCDTADHPIYPVESVIRELFEERGEVCCTADFEKLEDQDLLVIYNDKWEEALSSEKVSQILEFVSSGKTVIAIHCGIFYLQANSEFAALTAGRFYHHPPRCTLSYYLADESQEGAAFSLFEEPYLFHFVPEISKEVFLMAKYNNEWLPAGWKLRFGKGEFVYLAPGHDRESFESPVYREIILKHVKEALN